MRYFLFLSGLIIIALFSCNDHNAKPDKKSDSTEVAIKRLKSCDTLDDLFMISDEKQLKEVYSDRNVTTDTVWGAEGGFYIGTKLFAGSPDEVIIQWADATHHVKIASLRNACQYDENSERYILHSKWKTEAGVRLGTTLNKLIELNGKDFMFYGLGWDYGGGITSWQNGRLTRKNIFVTLGVDEMSDDQQKQYVKLTGEKIYSSDNPAARSLDPMVLEIILSRN